MTRGSSTTIGYSKRTSDSADPPYSAAAAESVCSRTDIGMISTPLLWCDPGYGLVVGVRCACHRCVGGVAATGMCRPNSVPGCGADSAVFTNSSALIQCRVWCHGALGRTGCGSGGCGRVGGRITCVLLRLVWKLTASSPLRDNVPTLWWCTDSKVSVTVACCSAATLTAWCSRTGRRTLATQ